MSNVCCLDHIAQTCSATAAVLYGSTQQETRNNKKLKGSYYGVLRRLL